MIRKLSIRKKEQNESLKIGPQIYIAPVYAWGEQGEIIGLGHPYAQTVQTLKNIEGILSRQGAGFKHVTRIRVYIKERAHWALVERALNEYIPCTQVLYSIVYVPELHEEGALLSLEPEAWKAD